VLVHSRFNATNELQVRKKKDDAMAVKKQMASSVGFACPGVLSFY
jgi:hypothetical protein